MRSVCLVVLLGATRAMADPAPAPSEPAHLPLSAGLSLRGGLHHTHVDKGDGAPTGSGPKLDAELTLRPVPMIIVAGFAGYSSYASDRLFDGVTDQFYDVSFQTWAVGGRLYVEPLPWFFVGIGVFDQSETEHSRWSNGMRAAALSHEETHVQFIVAGNLLRLGHFTVQAAGTYTQYDQFDRLEHVVSYGLMLGIHAE